MASEQTITNLNRDTAGYEALGRVITGFENVSGELFAFGSLLTFISELSDSEHANIEPWNALVDAVRAVERKLDDQIEQLYVYRRGEEGGAS